MADPETERTILRLLNKRLFVFAQIRIVPHRRRTHEEAALR